MKKLDLMDHWFSLIAYGISLWFAPIEGKTQKLIQPLSKVVWRKFGVTVLTTYFYYFITMIVGVPTETYPGEKRVALIPAIIPSLTKAGLEVIIESRAGSKAGYPDNAYTEKGGTIAK